MVYGVLFLVLFAMSLRLSAYASTLDGPAKIGYIDKVRRCNGADPLALTSNELNFELAGVPRVERVDINDYLVHGTKFITRAQLKAYKELEAYNFLVSEWVEVPKLRVLPDGMVVVVGKVNQPEGPNSQPLEPWLLLQADGAVELAHCTCMAGLEACCSHIAAVLFYLEAIVKERGDAGAELPNTLEPIYLKDVTCCPIADMDFSSATAKKRRPSGSEVQAAGRQRRSIPKPSEEEWNLFLRRMHASGTRPAFLALTEGYSHFYAPTGHSEEIVSDTGVRP